VDYYTYANRAVTLKPLDVFATAAATGGRRIHGEVMVASLVTLFKKLKFGTDENVGWGPIDLPELELQTTAYWLTFEGDRGTPEVARRLERKAPGSRAGERIDGYVSRPSGAGNAAIGADRGLEGWRKDDLDVALLGAGRAIQAVAAVLLMVDPRDLGLVTQVRSPHSEAPTIYLYEAVPGGIGLSERLWQRHDELVVGAKALIEACGCDSGCPACTGPRLDPEVDGKALALRLLRALVPAGRGVGDVAVPA
jgi:DEAD/DEAH box helicase domain-containing protein